MANKTSFPKRNIKILLLEGLHPSAVESFEADGYSSIESHAQALPQDQLIASIKNAHLLGIRSRTQLRPEILKHAKKLIAIGCYCIGTNQVDLDYAQTQGIPVFNAPFSNTRSVAELVVAEAVLMLRGIPERNALAHRGGWLKSADGSFEARGKKLGIVGYGHIGTQVGLLAEALGMRVYYYDIETKLALGNAVPVKSLDELLKLADIVSLHVPETPQTRNMIGAAQLQRMRPGALFINAARGTVVDVEAVAQALESGHLAGAAFDVFPSEPKGNDDEFVSPLRRFDNVILTPHIGGSTVEAQENIGREVTEKLIKYSNNGSTLSSVNFPEVSLPEHPGKRRLLHIHRNEPGLLSQINEVFSSSQMNIAAQYLQTSGQIGYVVIDVDANAEFGQMALKRLREIKGTIRSRILY
ncbi:MAG: phosphoglycerate dehydrogenase [Gammaproteobacteria bacterium]|nr:phosphoglycerate dehydrogenase [Gammaproteobacteria bacterium]MCP5425498.1 phosphoglycerate dehydrogenase [Gammaproteobacteria bacterium]MCP5459382.1 phosphoglycerate dehydrogenase [Gammaproteobacteria bacterium]